MSEPLVIDAESPYGREPRTELERAVATMCKLYALTAGPNKLVRFETKDFAVAMRTPSAPEGAEEK